MEMVFIFDCKRPITANSGTIIPRGQSQRTVAIFDSKMAITVNSGNVRAISVNISLLLYVGKQY